MPDRNALLSNDWDPNPSGIHAGNDKEALALAQAAGAQIFLGQDKDVTAPASKRHKKADRKSTESDSLASFSALEIAKKLFLLLLLAKPFILDNFL